MNVEAGKAHRLKVRTMVNVWKRASVVAVMCLAAPPVSAADAPANTAGGATTVLEPWPCEPGCPPPCSTICCPTKAPKVVCKDGTPRKIIVHQAEPIVEFRNEGPSRPINVDRNVHPVGGDCNSCKGGAGHAGGPRMVKNFYFGGGWGQGCGQGCGHNGHNKGHQGAGAYAYAPMAVQLQAYVPMAVTYAAPMAYGFAAGPTGFAFNGAGEGRPASDSSAATSAAQALQSAQAATAATASFEVRLKSLETKMSSIENRLGAIERGIDVLCEERAKARQ